MKTKIYLSAGTFLAFSGMTLFLAWCGGFNFERGPTGFGVAFCATVMSAFIASWPFAFLKD